ncbi:hypothetical protein [Hydrogenophaga sp.]|uniref:hypothetical protein n=1 Tax=Hydrogenophaga sp. TaxID=1904254 RepID=UPI00351E9462
MIALLHLKHAFNLSDEAVVARWREASRGQFFSGQAHDGERRPCDATTRSSSAACWVRAPALCGDDGVPPQDARHVQGAGLNDQAFYFTPFLCCKLALHPVHGHSGFKTSPWSPGGSSTWRLVSTRSRRRLLYEPDDQRSPPRSYPRPAWLRHQQA